MAEILKAEAIVLKVTDQGGVDKQVLCYSKEYGKLRFAAYGAKFAKSVKGRLLQPFARLQLELAPGQRVDKLLNCELASLPLGMDMRQLAYAAVLTEACDLLTEERAPQPSLYELLAASLEALTKRNPRLVALAFSVQLLRASGFAPSLEHCAACQRPLREEEDTFFSCTQGGALCSHCAALLGEEEAFPAAARAFWRQLDAIDLAAPSAFTVKGGTLLATEKVLGLYLLSLTERPLKSLAFIKELGL